MKPVAIWLSDAALMADETSYLELGFSEAIVLTLINGRELWRPETTPQSIRDVLTAVRGRTQGMKLWISLWCYDEVESWSKPLESSVWAAPEPAWEIFRERLKWTAEICESLGIHGICMDGEFYPATPGGNGGRMQKEFAWVDTPILRERAQVYGSILSASNVQPAFYVHVQDAFRLRGFREWVTAVYEGRAEGYLFGEDVFYKPTQGYATILEKARIAGAKPSAGLWFPKLKSPKFSTNVLAGWVKKSIQKCGHVWWYDPEGAIRLNQEKVKKALEKARKG